VNQGYPSPQDPNPSTPEYGREAIPQGPPAPRQVSIKTPSVAPTVSYIIMGLTVFVYLLQVASQYLLGNDWPALLGLKVNSLIVSGQVWRLFTPMLLHGSILHIGFNMYALYLFGPGLERHFGHWRFLALYVLSGFAGNVMSFLFATAPSLGSSTAIFGLLGAEGVFLYQNRELFGKNAQRALTNIVLVGVINLAIGLSPGIDNWGHVGGLLGGTLFAWFGGPMLKVEGIFPALTIVDQRGTDEVVRIGLLTGLFFTLLAAASIYLRGG